MILIFFLIYFKGNHTVFLNFEKYLDHYNKINLSIISYYEIYSGLKFKEATRQLKTFEKFADENIVLPLTETSCKISGKMYGQLMKEGNRIDDIDLLIAGIALDNDLVVITNNEKHFNKIPGIQIENWMKEQH